MPRRPQRAVSCAEGSKMSLLRILNVGANGMSSSSFATNVAAHNISNVSTDGFSRRQAVIEPLGPQPLGGNGSRAVGSRRVADQFLERRILGARALAGEANGATDSLRVLDQILREGGGTVGGAFDQLESSFVGLAARPNEPAARLDVLNRSEQLAASFRQSARELSQTRSDINDRIQTSVRDINARLDEIASLGAKISQAELSGQEASDLRDRRDVLVRDLASKIPISTVESDNGGMTVLLGGSIGLVSPDGQANHLIADTNTTTGDVHIYTVQAGQQVDITARIGSGEIGGMVSARDGALTTAQNDLDQLAYDTINAYNAVHSAGYGLDGGTGRNLFSPSATVAGSAINMQLSTDVAGAPDRIAAATDPNSLPGDNRNALALQGLADTTIANGGTQTMSQALSSFIARAGTALSSAMAQQTQSTASESQLMQLHDQVSGVSLDDEMVDMMRFQRAYQASVKVVQTADEMLQQLLAMKR